MTDNLETESGKETRFKKLKQALIDLIKQYPDGVAYGKIEFYLGPGKEKVDLLIEHKIIKELTKKEIENLSISEEEKKYRWYRLAPKGVDLAISMINLEHSENILEYSKNMKKLTHWIIVLSVLTLGLGIIQIFI